MPRGRVIAAVKGVVSAVILLCGFGLTSGCAIQQTYAFVDPSGQVSDTFTCLGISDEQWKSVLKPGRYSTDVNYCEVSPIQARTAGINFMVWGVRDPAYASGVPRNSAVPIDIAHFTPFMFYRFPESVGTGGVLWQSTAYESGPDDLRTASSADANPRLYLELYHAVHDGQVVSRGFWLWYGGADEIRAGDWREYSFLKGDVIADLVQLAFWGAQGLKAQYPDQFPNPLPAENPSPYVPPADGSLPTSTFTGTPNPPIHITPNRPSPTGESTP